MTGRGRERQERVSRFSARAAAPGAAASDGPGLDRVLDEVVRERLPAEIDLPAAHIYKIGPDGLMHEIEAMGFQAPYNSPTGWE